MPSTSRTLRSKACNISVPEMVDMSFSQSGDFGKFFLCTEIACRSISTDPAISNPARFAPRPNPPAPLNKSIIFKLLRLSFILPAIGDISVNYHETHNKNHGRIENPPLDHRSMPLATNPQEILMANIAASIQRGKKSVPRDQATWNR